MREVFGSIQFDTAGAGGPCHVTTNSNNGN